MNTRLRDSSILSSCEAEVQELMRQVDLMVDARKQEWANERRSLLAKLDIREQETAIQKATLSQKNSEVCLLTFLLFSFCYCFLSFLSCIKYLSLLLKKCVVILMTQLKMHTEYPSCHLLNIH